MNSLISTVMTSTPSFSSFFEKSRNPPALLFCRVRGQEHYKRSPSPPPAAAVWLRQLILGEVNPGELRGKTMNSPTRSLLNITAKDVAEADKVFSTQWADEVDWLDI